MRYSISGTFHISKQETVKEIIAKYPLWKPLTETNNGVWYSFEALLNAKNDKTNLFNKLKSLVSQSGEMIDWHECTQDENIPKPCIIAEIYRR